MTVAEDLIYTAHPSIPAEWGRGSIGFVSPAWPATDSTNGIVTYTHHMREGLGQLGVLSVILTWQITVNTATEAVVRLEQLPNGRGGSWERLMLKLRPEWWKSKAIGSTVANAVNGLQRKHGLCLLQMEESFGWAAGVIQQARVPVVVRLHGPRFLVGPASGASGRSFHRRVRDEGKAITAAGGISCASQFTLDRVKSFYGLTLEHAEVIPNAISPIPISERWQPESCEPNRLLFVGRFDSCKGGDLMVRAFSRVVDRYPEAKLTFVGPNQGMPDASGRRRSLEEFVQSHLPVSRQANLEYLGPRSKDEIRELRRRAFVTIVPSRFENFANTALEAMAAGSPLIVSDAGGLPEMVQHGRNGLLFRTGDEGDLAEQILSTLRNRDHAAKLGRQAAIDAADRYCPRKIAEQTLAFYDRVLDRWKQGREPRGD